MSTWYINEVYRKLQEQYTSQVTKAVQQNKLLTFLQVGISLPSADYRVRRDYLKLHQFWNMFQLILQHNLKWPINNKMTH